MPSIQRPLSGEALPFRLADEQKQISDQATREHGHAARTLVKNGPLRLTLITVAPGGEIKEHDAPGPITVHALSGSMRFITAQRTYELSAGELLALDAGIRHSVASEEGATFLLTVVAPT